MDPISGVASILSLLDTLRVITRATHNLYTRLRDATNELEALRKQVLFLGMELTEVERTIASAQPELISLEIRQALQTAIVNARIGISKVDDICQSFVAQSRSEIRVRYVFRERQRVEDALASIAQGRASLRDLMQLVVFKGAILSMKGIGDLKRIVSAQASNLAMVKPIADNTVAKRPKQRDGLHTDVWRSNRSYKAVGIDTTLVRTKEEKYTDYGFAVRINLPFGGLLGRYAVMLLISARTFPLCSTYRLLPGSSLTVARVVPQDDPFFEACAAGDLLRVRDMLHRGEGRITDIQEGNLTPLSTSIYHGRLEIVRELTNYGADINGTFGLYQTSPLQWAVRSRKYEIVRYLLSQNASQDHINFLGWNATFLCWPMLRRSDCMIDYLRLLAQDAYQDLDIVDTEGWTVLHRVAAYGTAAEVEELIHLGADPRQEALPLRWTAIHHSVYYGNDETFQALRPYHRNDLLTIIDERGWTLLHIAASANHNGILRTLLTEGADMHALSKPFASHMPECLFHQECTPRDVAAAQGQCVEDGYLQAVEELGLDVFYDAKDI